jgi:hypothetical protein
VHALRTCKDCVVISATRNAAAAVVCSHASVLRLLLLLQALRPKLNDEQKQQLEECFELMDADGSGAIDADELGAAFKVRAALA